MNDFQENMCPKCHYPKMKSWRDLTGEQKFLAERLPLNSEFTKEQRKKHRFCERCCFEKIELQTENVQSSMSIFNCRTSVKSVFYTPAINYFFLNLLGSSVISPLIYAVISVPFGIVMSLPFINRKKGAAGKNKILDATIAPVIAPV